MSLFSKIASMSHKAIAAGVITAAVVGFGGLKMANAGAQNISIGGPSDCDSNAVIYCGAHSVNQLINSYNNSGAVKDIYSYFGISSNDIHSMDNANTHVEAGYVTKSGNVLDASGNVVATGALTAGRQFIAGSNHVVHGGTSFYTRPPSVSFQSNTLSAFVVISNGQFQYAIISSCGNPVKATPTHTPKPQPKPAYEIEKKVKEKGTNDDFGKNVHVKPGAHVIYAVNVHSTGDAAVKNVVVKDKLPNKVQYVNGTLAQDNNGLGPNAAAKFFDGGITLDSIPAGQNVRFTFEAVVGPNETPDKCQKEQLTNVARINASTLPAEDSSADVVKECQEQKPNYACEKLEVISLSRTSYTFKAKASASNGATIKGYVFDFGDGQTATVNTNSNRASANHSYPNIDQDKTYNAKVSVMVRVNGEVKTVSGQDCKVSVHVKAQPAAECTKLNLSVGDNRTITTNVEVATRNGAKLNSVTYDFDDGTTKLVNDTNPVSHTYAADGDYLVKATVVFDINGAKTSSLCQAPVSFVPHQPTCEEITPKPESCKTCEETSPTPEMCKPTCEETSPSPENCQHQPSCEELASKDNTVVCNTTTTTTTPGTPTSLVNTGPGSVAAIFAIVTAAGTFLHRRLLTGRL